MKRQPRVTVRATDAELRAAGTGREAITRGARRLSLELGAQFLPTEADRSAAAASLEAMTGEGRRAHATVGTQPGATTARRKSSEVDRAAKAIERGELGGFGASGPSAEGPAV